MKITIKNYRSCAGNEGDAFSCTIYLDGKRAATVQNAGYGGGNDYDFRCSDGQSYNGPLCTRFRAFIDGLPPRQTDLPDHDDPTKKWMMPVCMDTLVDDAIADMLLERKLKTWCRTKLVFRYTDSPKGQYQICKAKWAGNEAELRAQVATWAKADGKVVAEIVNERFEKRAA